MENLPPIVETALGYVQQGQEIALAWLTSPVALSQFGLLIASFVGAWIATRKLKPFLAKWLTPHESSQSYFAQACRIIVQMLPLLLPLLAFAFTSAGEQITRSLFGSGELIAFGKRVFLFIAVRIFVREVLRDPMLRLLGRFVLLPVAALYALGLLEPAVEKLDSIVIPLGNLSFTALWAIRFVVVAGAIFWLGRWSNDQSTQMIQAQKEMRPATRELAAKAAEIAIFGVAFLLVMNIMGVPLASLAVLTGAIGVGLGFGLQKIASNFISGVILLLEGQATVGDYVELDGGEAGTIIRMMARAAILETFDGRWIVVPNEDFIVTRVINYSDAGSAKRYEVDFRVGFDEDLPQVRRIIEEAVSQAPFVLQEPFPPDAEFRNLGLYGAEFAVEFWAEGLDDGKNRYTSDIRFVVWQALKDNGIKIPFPHQTVQVEGSMNARMRNG